MTRQTFSNRIKVGLSTIILLTFSFRLNAYTERNLLRSQADENTLRQILVANQQWVPFPAYANRMAWDELTDGIKQQIVEQGERWLTHEWMKITATNYLDFERSGNRWIMEQPYLLNRAAFVDLLQAELVEGKGRFIDKLIDGVFYYCEMTTWSFSAHTVKQPSGRALPQIGVDVFDLYAGDMGTLLSWTYYFLHETFDRVDPEISRRMRYEIKHRIIDTYLNGPKLSWQVESYKGKGNINNWTAWCTFNALTTFMLMADDMDTYARGVYETMTSMDLFINFNRQDGACDEGPRYWNDSAGKLYDYLQMLYYATGGRIDIFNDTQIRNMGEYISNTYVGDGWVVNFADASARAASNPSHVYRYGKAVGSSLMMHHAAYLRRQQLQGKAVMQETDNITRNLEAIRCHKEFSKVGTDYDIPHRVVYPETQVCYIRNDNGQTLAAKGGTNGESHNHNDVGTFIYYQNNVPIFIDAGVVGYTRQTFDGSRYSLWPMQSDYHNLPRINGYSQHEGSRYKATHFEVGDNTFVVDIAKAYPEEAGVRTWERGYALFGQTFRITDRFLIDNPQQPNEVNFLTWGDVDVSRPGEATITVNGQHARLSYDATRMNCRVERKQFDDRKLTAVWGTEVVRISFTDKLLTRKGSYTFRVVPL
ncbi:MAG: heparinase II/III family protein [Bacteroidales bacterium]|nr:heparinase II/III family protein [Bacteroidales bacterium]